MPTYAGKYSEDLQDRYGNGFANAKVAVQTLVGGVVTLYADRAKTAYVPASGLATNEIRADTKGNLTFFADPGNYQIVVTPSGGVAQTPISASVLLDPNEPIAMDASVVHKTGDETVAGVKIWTDDNEFDANIRWRKKPYICANHHEFQARPDGTDNYERIQAAIDALNDLPGKVYLEGPPNIATEDIGWGDIHYGLSEGLVSGQGQHLIGELSTSPGALTGVILKALPGFVGDRIWRSKTWDDGGTWHWGSVQDIAFNCNGLCAGPSVYQMGEHALLRRLFVTGYIEGGIVLTGVHAPATVDLCSVWYPVSGWGFKMTSHPTLPGNTGVVRFLSPSGDSTVAGTGHFYSDGSHQVTAIGVKSESWPIGFRWEGSGSGGGAGSAFITGDFNGAGAPGTVNCIEIQGTARPSFTLRIRPSGYTNIINDAVSPGILAAADLTNLPNFITWNGIEYHGAGEFIMHHLRGIRGRRADTGAIFDMLVSNSALEVQLKDRGGNAGIRLGNNQVGFFGATPVAKPAANPDTSGATLTELEAEVNQLKATLRSLGLLTP